MLMIFLKKNEVKKIQMLGLIIYRQKISVGDLMIELDTTRGTVDRLLQQLAEDLATVYEGEQQLEKGADGRYFLADTITKKQKHPMQAVYQYYLQYSSIYQFFQLLLTNNSLTVEKTCEILNVSTTYSYNMIKKLNEFLATFQLTISLQQQKIQLEGEEHRIFTFVYNHLLFNSDILQSSNEKIQKDWQINLQAEKDYTPLEEISLNRYKSMKIAAFLRRQYATNISIQSKEVREILQVVVEEHDLFKETPEEYYILTKDIQLFANFFVRMHFPTIDSISTKIYIGKKLVKYDNSIVTFCQQLLEAFIEKFALQVREDDYYEMFSSLVLHRIYNQLFDIDFKKAFKLSVLEPMLVPKDVEETNKKVRDFYYKYLQERNLECEEAKDFTLIAIETLTTFLVAYTDIKLKVSIYIDYPNNVSEERLIYKRIKKYFHPDLIQFVDTVNEADIVLTDYLVETPKDIRLFYINEVSSNSMWSRIFSTIGQIVLAKYNEYMENV